MRKHVITGACSPRKILTFTTSGDRCAPCHMHIIYSHTILLLTFEVDCTKYRHIIHDSMRRKVDEVSCRVM